MDDQLRNYIQKLREDFSKSTLSEKDADPLPSKQFKAWMQDAVDARIIELQAMVLSTVSPDGWPSSRIVYLREFGEDCYTFYTNYNSRKGEDLRHNPRAALNFFWPHLERQVRIEGLVKKSDPAVSDAYFMNRPFDSQIGAWASVQSAELSSRDELDARFSEIKNKFTPHTIKRPEFWGGYTLQATYYEFWQGRKNRLHDRLAYRFENTNWKLVRLSP